MYRRMSNASTYCAVGACLAFGLYALLQPSRAPNGLAGYDPPPGAVVKYGKPSLATTVGRGAEASTG